MSWVEVWGLVMVALAAVCWWALERLGDEDDLGRVSGGWLRRDREGRQ